MQARLFSSPRLAALIIAACIALLWTVCAPSGRALAQMEPAAGDEADEQMLALTAVADTTLDQQNPNTNFGGAQELRAGVTVVGEFGVFTVPLLRWNLGIIPPGSTIHEADFGLFQTTGGANSLLIFRVLEAWDEGTATFNTLPDSTIYDRTWTPPATTGEYVRRDITDLVNGWVNNSADTPNHGLLLRSIGNQETRVFHSREAVGNTPPVLRVRFTLPRIRVCQNTAQTCKPAAGAEVFNQAGNLIAVTDANGLINSDLVRLGNSLWARAAAGQPSAQSRLFYTSGDPMRVTAAAFQLYPDSNFNEMRLVVSPNQPLLLYDLNVSAQWYLEDNPGRVEWLQTGIISASNHLYDFTEGQFALGTVTVRQMYEGWDEADIKLFTNNVLHPNANVGGIVAAATPDIWATLSLTYTPGSVYMGSHWNRFGAPPGEEVSYGGQVVPQAEMAGDWALSLAHELGHYLLFLFDTYTDADGVSSEAVAAACTPSAMGNVYLPANHAFIANQAAWDTNCGPTEAHARLGGRSEWATITGWHTWAVTPAAIKTGAYPPVPLTQVVFISPAELPPPAYTMPYTLTYQLGQTSSGEARVFLLRDDSLIFEQGKPPEGAITLQLVDARLGDRLCVYDLNDHAEGGDAPRHQWGCEAVVANDNVLSMTLDAAWSPLVTIEQTGAEQLLVTVEQPLPAAAQLWARVIPETGPALPSQMLVGGGDERSALFDLGEPVMPLYLQLWVEETPTSPQTRREVMADRGVGGNGAFDPARLYSGVLALSSDGEAAYQSEEPLTLGVGESVAWQSMPGTPPLPPQLRISGQSYRLDAFPNSLVFSGTVNIRFNDAFGLMAATQTAGQGSARPATQSATEPAVHFWDGERWQRLATTIGIPATAPDGVLLATAPSRGVGVYAVLIDTPHTLFLPSLSR